MKHQIYDMQLISPDNIGEIKYKYFIMAPNIEKRSREAFLKLCNKGTFEKIIIMDYANFHKVPERDREETEAIYSDFEHISMIRLEAANDNDAVRLLRNVGIGKMNR